ncbi:Myosin type II heavy chain [Mycena indigotica]|uniref:Myosin type II heavy chain n=1 Tax=Mycena indigotica TaxID=2126181 RepID=A0A8H6SQ10_9AGAR|nr:Myosin type II heavy chain [Mycena indigotica]KAF7303718.1 Myosin type II heavy chain [Mycena indigotica]
MPAPRPSESAAARAAAQQAEFNEKKWVWVPDDKDGYLAGWVNSEEGDYAQIIMSANGEFRNVPLYALSKMNPPKFDRVEDIADLTFLNEASVVHNLRLRFGSGAIYTYSGLFLVAINPYQSLPLYSDAIIQQYRSKRRDENPPHIFAVAERAWVNMGDERENQSILITGESGAGKTESTKKVIQYLAAIATDVHIAHSRSPTIGTSASTASISRSDSFRRGHGPSSSSGTGSHMTARGRLGLLERQILQANPILEAFGNAQTQRNNNSSRFGKFVRITFAPDGSIAGANIDWYLLEKSRVVVRSEAERNFHVFYQLMAGGGSLKENLLLSGGIEDYEYLNMSRREVDGVDDKEEWSLLKGALDIVGFTTAEQFDLFRIVAAILHIGNITITSTRADDAVMPDPSQAERVCHLLGMPVADFTRAVLRPRTLAGREWVTQARTKQQALDELGSLCKTLYEKSFSAIVDRINVALDRPSSKSTFIGVLDIAGFEIFEINGYEQLLINYTNEKLQQFFNHHMFVLEQEEYAREGIKWDYVNFGLDLQPTIDLIEASGSVIGILSCLDEECIMPRATDLTFTNKLHGLWAGGVDDEHSHSGRSKYDPTRFDQGFIVHHYAANVEYRTDGWLEKNKDPLNDNLTRVLAASSDRYVASLFAEYADTPNASGSMFVASKKRGTKKGAFRTVAQRHKEQLSSLMSQLQATQPHFVRCIVPNSNKKPGRLDVPLVLDQLRCNGVLEGIRIARLGYPNRLPFVEFRQRYEVLTPGIIPRGYMDGREACRRMVKALELDDAIFKIGTSKIFFKAGVLAELEERRDALLFEIFSRLQAVARMWTARRQMKKILHRAVAIRTIQRNARVYAELRDWPWWQLYTKVRPLLAATRNDEELRKKEAELSLIKERAERDKQEREALETLKSSLEAEKRRVEEELEAERMLAIDKNIVLERSKKRESELEDEISALQSDLDMLDSQLDRAMKLQKESDDKFENLRQMFDQAAEHLVRLEADEKTWASKEQELNAQLLSAHKEAESMQSTIQELHKIGEELKNLALQREEDLARTKERADGAVKEWEAKLQAGAKTGEILQHKVDELEESRRQSHQHLAEMERTVTTSAKSIQDRDTQLKNLSDQIASMKKLHGEALTEIRALQNDINALEGELEVERGYRTNENETRKKLEHELDELRKMMEAKTSEATRRAEAEKSKEQELANLREQAQRLQQDLSDGRKQLVDAQKQLKLELETSRREHLALQESHKSLEAREQTVEAELKRALAQVGELEKSRRSLESELQSTHTRHNDIQEQLAETKKAKEALDRQLAVSLHKHHEIEDVMLQLERDKSAQDRQLDVLKQQFENESTKRSQLEQSLASRKNDIAQLKQQNTELDAALAQALLDIQTRDHEVKQIETKQHTTIVEHVHVLEEAKRVTDRELADARAELEQNRAYIRSLEKAKTGLMREAEDLTRETERERLELQAKERLVKAQEDKMVKAVAEAERDRKEKDAAELQTRRLQIELQSTQRQVEELNHQLSQLRRSKDQLDADLDRLVDDNAEPARKSMARRISQLEGQIIESNSPRMPARYDGEGPSDWRRQKERLELKLAEMTKAYERSSAEQSEQRSQITTMQGQVSELRSALNDVEADRLMLQNARKALQSELETIRHDHIDTSLVSSDREMHKLQLRQLELERTVDEQEYRSAQSLERMKKAEIKASQSEIDLGKVRVEKSALDRLNANLEKQVIELRGRINELESRPPSTPRAVKRESRIEELQNQLQNKSRR